MNSLLSQRFHQIQMEHRDLEPNWVDIHKSLEFQLSPQRLLDVSLSVPKSEQVLSDIENAAVSDTYDKKDTAESMIPKIQHAAIQRDPGTSDEVSVILTALFRPNNKPDPHLFDGIILIQYYQTPVLYLRNAQCPKSGYTLRIDLRLMRQFIDERVKETIRDQRQTKALERIDEIQYQQDLQAKAWCILSIGVAALAVLMIASHSYRK